MVLDALHKIANHGSSLTRDEARWVVAEVLCDEATDAPVPPRGTTEDSPPFQRWVDWHKRSGVPRGRHHSSAKDIPRVKFDSRFSQ